MMADLRRNFLFLVFCLIIYNVDTASVLNDDDLNKMVAKRSTEVSAMGTNDSNEASGTEESGMEAFGTEGFGMEASDTGKPGTEKPSTVVTDFNKVSVVKVNPYNKAHDKKVDHFSENKYENKKQTKNKKENDLVVRDPGDDDNENKGYTSGQKAVLGVTIPIFIFALALVAMFMLNFKIGNKKYKSKGAGKGSFNNESNKEEKHTSSLPRDKNNDEEDDEEDLLPNWRDSVRDSAYEEVHHNIEFPETN